LVLGFLVGPIGLVFAAPVAAVFPSLARSVYLHDVLGEPKETFG
jgi:predicted PurR-regulated permease PerM